MIKNKQNNKQNKIEYSYDSKIDTKYLFIIILIYFIQPDYSGLDETSINIELNQGMSLEVSKEILEMQMSYSILVLLIVLFYLK